MPIPFIKYSGSGNDFILVDCRTTQLKLVSEAIAKLCARNTGIGADGLLLVERSESATARMRIFNADGREAEMCGNGIRCIAHYLASLPPHPVQLTIETMNHRINVAIERDGIITEYPPPTHVRLNRKIRLASGSVTAHTLDTGVPHTVLFTETLNDPSFVTLAKEIRHHDDFAPKGTNVNLAERLPNGHIAIRTYERGVEGETLACGTGAMATAIAAVQLHHLPLPIVVVPRSGDPLTIAFSGSSQSPEHLTMKGPAIQVFNGLFLRESFGFPE